MPGLLQLTNQVNPLAQLFRVTEPFGSVITGVGVFFSRAPATTDDQYPVTVELRPIENSGTPSAQRYIAGTQVSATAAQIRSVVDASGGTSGAGGEFNTSAEYKFTFPDPVFIPANTEVAIVVGTNAPAGKYKVWSGRIGDYVYGSTERKVTQDLSAGGFYQSGNGTSWLLEPYSDLAFKVYRAVFSATGNYATFSPDVPPVKALTENQHLDKLTGYVADPLIFTAGSDKVKVRHPAHGFQEGDRVRLSYTSAGFDSGDTVNGVSGASILGTRTIDSADPYGYTFTMDESADSSVRAGGTGLLASEQYVMNQFKVKVPRSAPNQTSMYLVGDLTTTKSFGGSETAYQETANIAMDFNKYIKLRNPHVLTTTVQETLQLSGERSAEFRVGMDTNDRFVAPFIHTSGMALETVQHFIDNPQSDDSDATNRNNITTVDYVAETAADGGTGTFKHLSRKFRISNAASSIRVYVDAVRPDGAEFDVWYRTNVAGSDVNIADVDWTVFSKTQVSPNTSNYLDVPQNDGAFRQYEFNQFDIASFDEYQIKY